MNKKNTEQIAWFLPLLGVLTWSFTVFMDSLSTGEAWRITAAGIGFFLFLSLAIVFGWVVFIRKKKHS